MFGELMTLDIVALSVAILFSGMRKVVFFLRADDVGVSVFERYVAVTPMSSSMVSAYASFSRLCKTFVDALTRHLSAEACDTFKFASEVMFAATLGLPECWFCLGDLGTDDLYD